MRLERSKDIPVDMIVYTYFRSYNHFCYNLFCTEHTSYLAYLSRTVSYLLLVASPNHYGIEVVCGFKQANNCRKIRANLCPFRFNVNF